MLAAVKFSENAQDMLSCHHDCDIDYWLFVNKTSHVFDIDMSLFALHPDETKLITMEDEVQEPWIRIVTSIPITR